MASFTSLIAEQWNRFWFSSAEVTRQGPHIRDTNNVQRVWNTFVLASVPSALIGCWSLGREANQAIEALGATAATGWRVALLQSLHLGLDVGSAAACFAHGLLYLLPVLLLALVTGAVWDALFARLRNRAPDEGLLYVAWFLTLMMPSTAPPYLVVLGMSFGMVVGKLIFGGSGRYLINPALLGIGFLLLSYHSVLFGEGTWVPIPGWENPSVLELVATEGGLPVVHSLDYHWLGLFIGDKPGTIGTVSPLGALIGALILAWSGVAAWRVMAGSVIGLVAMTLLFNALPPATPLFSVPWYWHLVLGGYTFGAVYIATDPVTTPMTDAGRWGFGLLVGALTLLIRVGNPSYYDGVLFAIMLACLFSPLIDHFVVRRNIRRRALRLLEPHHGD